MPDITNNIGIEIPFYGKEGDFIKRVKAIADSLVDEANDSFKCDENNVCTGNNSFSGTSTFTGTITSNSTISVTGAGQFLSHVAAGGFSSEPGYGFTGKADIGMFCTSDNYVGIKNSDSSYFYLLDDNTCGIFLNGVQQLLLQTNRLTSTQTVEAQSGARFKTSSGSPAGSSVLTHYEEAGTFTPAIAYATPGTSTFTITSAYGRYERVGKEVSYTLTLVWSGFTAGGHSGNLEISGLPYASANVTGNACAGSIYYQQITVPTGSVDSMPSVGANSSKILIYSAITTSDAAIWGSTAAGFDTPNAAGSMVITGKYFVA